MSVESHGDSCQIFYKMPQQNNHGWKTLLHKRFHQYLANHPAINRALVRVDGTVFGYLHSHRLERAHDLLREDLLSLSEIAYAVGFSNRGCFAAAFCKKFGMNPRDFRRSQQAQFRSKLDRKSVV